jgi:hypothetical protein
MTGGRDLQLRITFDDGVGMVVLVQTEVVRLKERLRKLFPSQVWFLELSACVFVLSSILLSLRVVRWCMYEKEKEGRREIKYPKTTP